ncbi:MAG: class I SAM-dependent methyltransferase [Gemmatimonadales bacterium]|nr:class I SAM-dependent methyltransferase [Gemmatimonadales bacterium]
MAGQFVPPSQSGMRGHVSDLVIAWAVEKYGARRLVDLGCGNGRDALQLIRCGLADFVLGIDNGSEPHNGKIAVVKDMVPSDVAGRLRLVEGDYATLTIDEDEFDLCYSNNVIEHVKDPQLFVEFSLWMAPLAMFVLPHVRHGWCDDHLHWWTASEFRILMEKHGEVLEFGAMADPPPFPCDEQECKHELLFALIRRPACQIPT